MQILLTWREYYRIRLDDAKFIQMVADGAFEGTAVSTVDCCSVDTTVLPPRRVTVVGCGRAEEKRHGEMIILPSKGAILREQKLRFVACLFLDDLSLEFIKCASPRGQFVTPECG